MALRTSLKWVRRGLGLSVLGTCTVSTYKYNTDEGIARTMQFTAAVTPMCWRYWRTKSTLSDKPEELNKEMKNLHKKYAPEMLRIVLKMKGYYIKAAQMMVGVGMLPEEYEEELKCLLDSVPPRETELVKAIIQSELGVPIEEVFETFIEKPIGAASIAQVHLATLKGSGKTVVVKVQYPEVEKFFRIDMTTVKVMCRLMNVMPKNGDKMFDEMEKSFEEEFDYRLESKNLRKCSENLSYAGYGDRVFVPLPVDSQHPLCPKTKYGEGADGLCSRKIMVMEAVNGQPIKSRMKKMFKDMATNKGVSVEVLMKEMMEQFEDPVKLKEMLNTPPPSAF